MDVAQVVAVWLHTVAFVIAWGYYGVLGRIVLPALERSLERPTQAAALAEVERRALPLVIVTLALFFVTGSYLLIANERYTGLGDFFSSTWTTLMLVKHLVVFGLVALGVAVDYFARMAAAAVDDRERDIALGRLRLSAEGATGLGAVIALLTAAAQAS